MKLRSRKKRVLGNTKQEDRKPLLSIAESSTDIVADASSVNLTVKQEDTTKEDKKLLQQDDELGKKGYYYRCDRCEVEMTDLKSVLEHRRSIHYVKKSKRKIKHL
ncbi:hypothetical protein MBANPS3_011290, partial [Mucor bainieri]